MKAKLLGGAGVLALVVVFVVMPASGDAPADLSVYAGQGIATPIGIVTRVPAVTAGGVVYAETDLELGKARAIAAGFTPGALAETFLATTLKSYANPSLVTAQYPSSAAFPSEATAPTGSSNGNASVGHFHAVADAVPSSTAEATGGAGGVPNVFGIGGGTSRSRSMVEADGTVVTTVVSALQNVHIGPDAAPAITIGHMTSTAQVKVPLGGKPVASVTVQMTGTLIGGVPATITQDGINVANTVPLPATALATVNQALAQLEAQGIRVQAVPVTKRLSDTDGTASGAALEIGYKVPPQTQLPTDIGKDETVFLGQVSAEAAGRKHQPLNLGEVPVLAQGPGESGIAGGQEAPASLLPSPAGASSPVAVAAPAVAAPGAEPFRLPHRIRNSSAQRVLSGYGIVMLTALIAAAAYALASRTRLTE